MGIKMSKKDKRGIKQTFKEIDVDGDGTITAECLDWFNNGLLKVSQIQNEFMKSSCSKNANQKLPRFLPWKFLTGVGQRSC